LAPQSTETGRKVAVITGASQGIGAHLVEAFRSRDYRVVAVSRSIAPTNDSDILTIAGDIANADISERAIAEAVAQFGRIDTLVNNAGVFIAKPFTAYTDKDYDFVLGVNLRGFFNITQPVMRQMLKQRSGHIVQVTSSLTDHARSDVPSLLAALTKGGLNSATKSLSIEVAGQGIRVNAVALGIIKTPMNGPETHEALAKMHPLGRMGEISDVVQGILYLEDAPFITGEILHIDGGQSAGH
jgi:NAD(P)-dependent dehydrogenase (short-subunit alcohol dehydrogenase family)